MTAAERHRLAAQGSDGRGVLALVEQGEETSRSTEVAPQRSPEADRANSTARRGGPADRDGRTRGDDEQESAPEPAVERGGVLAAVRAAGAAGEGALWWTLGVATLLLLLTAALQQRRD